MIEATSGFLGKRSSREPELLVVNQRKNDIVLVVISLLERFQVVPKILPLVVVRCVHGKSWKISSGFESLCKSIAAELLLKSHTYLARTLHLLQQKLLA